MYNIVNSLISYLATLEKVESNSGSASEIGSEPKFNRFSRAIPCPHPLSMPPSLVTIHQRVPELSCTHTHTRVITYLFRQRRDDISWVTIRVDFQANVTTLRSPYEVNRPSVCLCVTLVHATQRAELFGNIFAPSNSPRTRTLSIKILEKNQRSSHLAS